jgi:DNA mismatch endonuclease (patch repair protein)
MGWRVLEVWECTFKGPGRLNHESMSDLVAEWILNGTDFGQIEGHSSTTPA